MKKALITLVALALGMTAFAQFGPGPRGGGRGVSYGHNYGHIGHRPGYGYSYFDGSAFELGITLNHFGHREVERPDRVGFFGEYRVYLGPYVDMGLQLSTTFGKGKSVWDDIVSPSRYWQGAPLVMADINLLPYSGFNPYIGIGIGPGFGFEKYQGSEHGEWTQSLVISPRAGVELFERLRLSVQYQWYLNEGAKYSNVAFGLSWSFPAGMGRRPMRI